MSDVAVTARTEGHRCCRLSVHPVREVVVTSSSEDKGNPEKLTERAKEAMEHAAEADEQASEAEQRARIAEQRAKEAEEHARQAEKHAGEAQEEATHHDHGPHDTGHGSDQDQGSYYDDGYAPSVDSYGGEEPPDGGPE
jgi:Alanine-zipper, major outer membrane lipoprotein